MTLKVLFVEDDEKIGPNLISIFKNIEIGGYYIKPELKTTFEEGISSISTTDYDIVVLDLYQDKGVKDEEAGLKVLNSIRQTAFVPVIFYTGHAHKISDLSSEIVGIVNKSDEIDDLIKEFTRIISSNIALLKGKIYKHLRESLRQYFWETVDNQKSIFRPGKSDVSLGYLLLRRFAHSLSKENIKQLLGDDNIKIDKVHPMEFYIFPVNVKEYEAGEIIVRNGYKYIMLTPSCDYVLRMKKDKSTYRDVGRVLLARIFPLSICDEYVRHKAAPSKQTENNLKDLITNKKPRFFFLPGTPFLENSIIDFQNKTMVEYEDLPKFERLTKLDDPYAQSMITSFIRYYNRIGFPDIDTEYVLANI